MLIVKFITHHSLFFPMAVRNDNMLLNSFNFKVEFKHIPDLAEQQFQEVSGLSWELEVEELPVGGINDYTVRLPKHIRYPSNLILKRAMMTDSALSKWMEDTIQAYFVSSANPTSLVSMVSKGNSRKTTDIIISLMNQDNDKSLLRWEVYGAFPMKWNISPFNASENKFVTETLEFGFKYFKRV
jgi:phage tail-like protein